MSNAPLMLGVSGLRGIVGQSLTIDAAQRYAAAFAGFLCDRVQNRYAPRVVLAADGRLGWQALTAAATSGLLARGCDVIDIGIATTPTAGVATSDRGADGALIVTASHNPQEWNGIKCLISERFLASRLADLPRDEIEGCARASACGPHAPSPAAARQIIERFHGGIARSATVRPGQPSRWIEAPAAHVNRIDSALWELDLSIEDVFIALRDMHIVVDSVNASGSTLIRAFFILDGPRITQLFGDDSGRFPHAPEPLAENLSELRQAVIGLGADVGFAQDPDADRLAIIDETGRYIGEEYTLVLAARALLEARAAGRLESPADARGKPVIVTNLSTSRMIDDLAARHNAEVIRTPVGEANVVDAMKRLATEGRHVILGGEGNGGVIWPEVVHVRDSLSAIALTLALMARTGKAVSQLIADLPAYAIEKRKAPLPSRDAAVPALDALARHFSMRHDARLDTQDGVRIDLAEPSAWLHVRPSNTEPILRLIAEAPTPNAARALLDQAARVIESA